MWRNFFAHPEAGRANFKFKIVDKNHGSFGSTLDKWRPDAKDRDPKVWINHGSPGSSQPVKSTKVDIWLKNVHLAYGMPTKTVKQDSKSGRP